MGSASRPDLLPLALGSALGCPYHGLVIDGVLTLPNSATQARSTLTGETHYVRHPKAKTVNRTADEQAADTAAGRVWKDYALLSGADREICGQELGGWESGAVHWLYCDANVAWDVSLEFSTDGITQTLDCYLEGLFGLFTKDDVSMTRRKLATVTYTPKQYSGSNQTSGQAALGRNVSASHSKTGATTTINVGAVTNSTQPWSSSQLQIEVSGAAYTLGIHNSYRLNISGNGSLTPGVVGTGISGTFVSLAEAPDMIVAASGSGNTYSYTHQFFWSIDKDGNLTNIVDDFAQESTTEVEGGTTTITYTAAQDVSFGGESVTAAVSGYIIDRQESDPLGDEEYVETNGVAGAYGTVLPYYVHPNVVLLWLNFPGGAKIVAADGTMTEPTWTDERPLPANTSWEPGTGVITFTEGVTQGYV